MIGYGDEARVMDLLAPLRRLEPVTLPGPKQAKPRPLLRRPILVASVLVVLLALAGVAIAAGFGAFNGIGAAQRSQNGSDILDSRVTGSCADGDFYDPFCHLVPGSVRLIRTLASGRKVYVVADTRGDLCVVDEGQTITSSCGPPLSASHPITGTFANDSPTTGGEFVAGGVAMNGVTSVSFTVGDQSITVPVVNNVWIHEEPHSHATGARCVVAHFADGSTVDPFPEACP